jgi:hypothetical protein
MNQKKLRKRIQKIMQEGGDNCSACGKPFPHMCTTYTGEIVSGELVVVGDCCVKKLRRQMAAGIYLAPILFGSKTQH